MCFKGGLRRGTPSVLTLLMEPPQGDEPEDRGFSRRKIRAPEATSGEYTQCMRGMIAA